MPAESSRHSHTLMAYPSIDSADNEDDLKAMQSEIVTIANAISAFEPVHLYTRPALVDQAKSLVAREVFVKAGPADQLWIRDSGPVYVKDEKGVLTAVNFNFDYWGKKLSRTGDEHLAPAIAEQAGEPSVRSRLTLEGGGLEHDGEGTFLGTESCIINDNRNPGMTKAEIERELGSLLGVTHFIWLPGVAGGGELPEFSSGTCADPCFARHHGRSHRCCRKIREAWGCAVAQAQCKRGHQDA
jgi:agmatine deiminase